MIATGGGAARLSGVAWPPMSAVSSALTILRNCCSGVRLASTSWPSALVRTPLGEVLDHLEMHVGLEQRQAHVAHRVLDVALGDLADTAQLTDGLIEFFAQGVEHWCFTPL